MARKRKSIIKVKLGGISSPRSFTTVEN